MRRRGNKHNYETMRYFLEDLVINNVAKENIINFVKNDKVKRLNLEQKNDSYIFNVKAIYENINNDTFKLTVDKLHREVREYNCKGKKKSIRIGS